MGPTRSIFSLKSLLKKSSVFHVFSTKVVCLINSRHLACAVLQGGVEAKVGFAEVRRSWAEDCRVRACLQSRQRRVAPLPRGSAVEAGRRKDSRAGREEAEALPAHSSA